MQEKNLRSTDAFHQAWKIPAEETVYGDYSMKYYISLMCETGRGLNAYSSLHYIGEDSPENWFRLPINWVDAVKAIETNLKFHPINAFTSAEIVLGDIETWVTVLFDSENNFQKVIVYNRS